ncbi:carbohydrate ABC transporter permease [Candidatus Aerophobetes bacterium]|nr:carbohydrate ABC transporter permease [Candidatus Aerophobetes bacterium]
MTKKETYLSFSRLLGIIALIIFGIWTVLPIVFMAFASFKMQVEIFAMPRFGDWGGLARWFVFKPTFLHYRELFGGRADFTRYLINSVILTFVSTAICVPLGLFASYSLSRGKMPGKDTIFFWVITTRMAPPVVVCVPLYFLFIRFGLIRTFPGMVLAYTTFSLPFAIWLLRGFIDAVPREIEEAARIDGLSRLRVFINVVIPLIRSGIGAVIMLVALFCWNEYLFTLILGGRQWETMPVRVTELQTATGVFWGQVLAGGTIVIIPMVIFGITVRKYIVRGLTMGALR